MNYLTTWQMTMYLFISSRYKVYIECLWNHPKRFILIKAIGKTGQLNEYHAQIKFFPLTDKLIFAIFFNICEIQKRCAIEEGRCLEPNFNLKIFQNAIN